MSYSSGMMNSRVTILNRTEMDGSKQWGDKTQFEPALVVWAAKDFNRGVKAMREGALDAYDTVMFRMRWNDVVTRNSQLECDGRRYQIISFNEDYKDNQIQITATEIVT